MEDDNILKIIFNEKHTSQLFNFDDKELAFWDNKVTKADKEITEYIDKVIHPKSRRKLKQFILQYNSNLGTYHYRESELYYNSGFNDCMNLILKSLISK